MVSYYTKESFGNARTLRNNNSSRFGKFTKISFTSFNRSDPNNSLQIKGCRFESYLLEKSRVIYHEVGERNFHIFYRIFSAENPALGLTSQSEFFYITPTAEHRKTQSVDENKADKKMFEQMKKGLELIKMELPVQTNLFEHLAGILHLGNIKFEDDGKSFAKISESTRPSLTKTAELFGLKVEKMEERLIKRKIKVMRETIASSLTIEEAYTNRDAIAKSVFMGLFDWIFGEINQFFKVQSEDQDEKYIGILDIFGFEAFLRNSFEQFCINYANERLQQVMDYDFFKNID